MGRAEQRISGITSILGTRKKHRFPPHDGLRRGESEKVLRVSIQVDEGKATQLIASQTIDKNATPAVRQFMEGVVQDAYRRLIAPSVETDLRLECKNRAETEAIRVFAHNLEKLLLLPPLPGHVVMGVDPGYRTGSKLAVVDATGALREYAVIHPDFDKPEHPKSNTLSKPFSISVPNMAFR